MNTVRVDIINAESLKLLENLARMGMIAVHKEEAVESKSNDFMDLIHRIRMLFLRKKTKVVIRLKKIIKKTNPIKFLHNYRFFQPHYQFFQLFQ